MFGEFGGVVVLEGGANARILLGRRNSTTGEHLLFILNSFDALPTKVLSLSGYVQDCGHGNGNVYLKLLEICIK